MLLHQQFVNIAKKYKDKIAIKDIYSKREVSYSKALIASLILARRFRRYDEGLIGIMVPPSAGCALSVLGALMSGRTPVMINYSTGAAENAEFAQRKCNFKTIVTSKALIQKLDCRVVKGMVFLEEIMADITKVEKLRAAFISKLSPGLINKKIHHGEEEDDAVILFTSGSEKEPKAVQLSHKNISSNIEAFAPLFNLSHKETVLSQLPFFHVFGLTVCLWLPLYFGITMITYANPIDFKAICKIVRDEKPTMMVGTPSFFWGYLKRSEPGDFKNLRVAVVGADKCPDTLRKGFKQRHNITLLEGYGTTETAPVISANTPERNKPGSIGQPLPGVKIKIEDYKTGEICNINETGKILVKGPNVMKGYFDDIEETSLHITNGWYETGDMGLMDEDGYLWHLGRLKRFVKIGGEMVSLVKVEDVLQSYLPEEITCCVVGIPDPEKGAKIVAAITGEIDEKQALKHLSKHLPNIALPKRFLIFEDLPRMGSGKTDFRTITEMVRKMLEG